MTTVDLKADAAIQITASHHPFDRNGLKFFTPAGGLDSSDITEIVKLADNGEEIICNRAGVAVKLTLYGKIRRKAAQNDMRRCGQNRRRKAAYGL